MADTKLSALTGLSSVASGDLLYIVDVSDTTDGASGTSKKIARSDLVSGLANSGANSDITSLTGLTTPLSVAQGGSGAATLTGIVKGNGTSAFTAVTAPSGTIVGTSDTQTLTNKTLTSPNVGTAINDTNGNEIIKTPATASAVNEITVTNAATGNAPSVTATGGDTNIDLTLAGKGTGKVREDARYGTLTSNSDGATVTFNLATSNYHTVTLGGNRTLAVSNASVGQHFIIRLVQDGTGSRTVTWFSTIKWAGGGAPTLTTTASKTDVFGFSVTSSGNYDGFIIGQNL